MHLLKHYGNSNDHYNGKCLEDWDTPVWRDDSKFLSSVFHSFDGVDFFWGKIDELSVCCNSCRGNRLWKDNDSAVVLVWDQDGTNANIVLVSNGKEFFIFEDRWISWTKWWVSLKENAIIFAIFLEFSLLIWSETRYENLKSYTPETNKRGFRLD